MEAIIELYDGEHTLRDMSNEAWRGLNRDLRASLADRTTNEAATKVQTPGQGQGARAYVKVFSWFAKTTGQAKVGRRTKVMQPEQRKNVTMVADAVER